MEEAIVKIKEASLPISFPEGFAPLSLRKQDFLLRLLLSAIGYAPIACLCFAIFGWIPLHISGFTIVLPAYICAVALGIAFPAYGRMALRGLLLGVFATLVYDSTRLPFILSGRWPDFIPRIGDLLLAATNVPWPIGYLYRYLGDGGGMGIAFLMFFPRLRFRSRGAVIKAGIFYGVAIWGSLLLTLLLAPGAQTRLFPLNPLTFVMSLVGHLVYGGVLGLGVSYGKTKVHLPSL